MQKDRRQTVLFQFPSLPLEGKGDREAVDEVNLGVRTSLVPHYMPLSIAAPRQFAQIGGAYFYLLNI